MKESTLVKIALIIGLVGLVALYFISQHIEIKNYSTDSKDGDDVVLKGNVVKVSNNGDVVFIEVEFDDKMTVVAFPDNETLAINKNDNIEVTGKVQTYKEKAEIIARSIKVTG